MESFYSIQGEGFYSGHAAYFIRFGGCDVGCSWCDVKESWDAENHPFQSLDEIVEGALDSGSKIIVITGGEPMMYDLNSLTKALREKGLKTHLETSGAYEITGEWDWICFSPKKFKSPKDELYQKSHELKVIVANKHDLIWAEEHAQKITSNCKLFLQPEWSKAENSVPMILNFIRENPNWQISLQMHKYIGVP